MRKGELAEEMFFIMSGEVEVETKDGHRIATMGENMHFGEMSLLSEVVSVRSTSVIAKSNLTLAVLNIENFRLIC